MESKASPTSNELLEIILKLILTFYDATISLGILFLLMVDLFLTGEDLGSYLILLVILAVIFITDLGFKSKILPFLLKLNSLLSNTGKKVVESFIKSIAYLLLLIQIIVTPPSVPPNFLLANFASIDFYFLLLVLILSGLYLSMIPVIKLIFRPSAHTTS